MFPKFFVTRFISFPSYLFKDTLSYVYVILYYVELVDVYEWSVVR